MKIAVILPSLYTGGAERTAVSLANWLVNNTNNKIIFINMGINDNNYDIDRKVYYYEKNKKDSRIKNFIKIMKILKNERVDIIFEMLFTPLRIALPYKIFYNHNVKIIGSERNNPKRYPNLRGSIRSKICPYICDGYIFQTLEVQDMFSKRISKKSIVIPNAISNPNVYDIRRTSEVSKSIVSVGRLVYQKGFDILIKAFKKVTKKYPDYKLNIYGSGKLEKEIQNLIDELQLSNNVYLKGNSKNVMKEVAKNDIFIMTSRYEGMPNALMEAMSIGMPCISTNCIAGPSELIEDKVNGLLIECDNIDAVENSIISLIENETLREKISKNAKQILVTHSTDLIYSKYYNYFIEIYKASSVK